MMIDDHHPDCDGSDCGVYSCAYIVEDSWDPWEALAETWKGRLARARAALSRHGGRS